MIQIIYEVCLATLASMGFIILFNIKKDHLFIGSLNGGLAWLIYAVLLKMDYNNTFSIFVASSAMSLYAEVMARRIKTPATAFIVCGMIPLVPGGGVYNTIFAYVNKNYQEAQFLGISTLTNAITIAIGIVFVYSSFRMMMQKKKIKNNQKSLL